MEAADPLQLIRVTWGEGNLKFTRLTKKKRGGKEDEGRWGRFPNPADMVSSLFILKKMMGRGYHPPTC